MPEIYTYSKGWIRYSGGAEVAIDERFVLKTDYDQHNPTAKIYMPDDNTIIEGSDFVALKDYQAE